MRRRGCAPPVKLAVTVKIIFFGTPPIAAEFLEALVDHGHDIVAVVTKPDKPRGRSGMPQPSAVKELAQQRLPSIPIFQPPRISAPDHADLLAAHHADLFVVVAFGEIIKQHLLDMPRLDCINVHASLLPKYRGAAPIQRAIIEGETVTGMTIVDMVKELDAGDILGIAEVPVGHTTTTGELMVELQKAGTEALLKVIDDFAAGKVTRIPQDPALVTYAPKLVPADGKVSWEEPAQQLHNLVRGVTPHPGAWCYATINGKERRLKLSGTTVVKEQQGTPGEILGLSEQGLIVACGEGAVAIATLKMEGKRAMTAHEFFCGIPIDALSFPLERS